MSNLAIKPATYEDLWDLPPNMTGQIINGELIAQPRPAPKHTFAASHLNGVSHSNRGLFKHTELSNNIVLCIPLLLAISHQRKTPWNKKH